MIDNPTNLLVSNETDGLSAAELSAYLDEAEIILGGIRNGLLVIAQRNIAPIELEIPLRRVQTLRQSSANAGVNEVDLQLGDLESTILAMIDGREVDAGRGIRRALDITAQIEALFAEIRMSGEEIFGDVADFVEESFGVFQRGTAADHPEIQSVPEEKDVPPEDEFEIDEELLEVFAMEADELLQNIERDLEKLSQNSHDREALWEIRRNAHTFKGAAGVVGLKKPSRLAHRIEDLLDRLAESNTSSTEQIFTILLASTDLLKGMTNGENSVQVTEKLDRLNQDFDDVLASIGSADSAPESAPETVQETAVESELIETAADSVSVDEPVLEEKPRAVENRSVIRVSLGKLDELAQITREMVIGRAMFTQKLADLERQIEEFHNITRRLRSTSGRIENDFAVSAVNSDITFDTAGRHTVIDGGPEHFDSLEFDRYTEFHQAVSELAETSGDAVAVNTRVDAINETLISLFDRQRRLIDDLQEKLASIRLIAFGSLKTRFERAVRVTCDEVRKCVEVVVENGHLELDSQIIDGLVEPTMHLLKNAVVHGIESAETRRMLGKPEAGKIVIRLIDEETHIVLTVSDDGGGIAVSALREKAVSTGVIDRGTADAMTEDDILGLIFHSGLTTAENLSLSAGRGIGMNIVRQSLNALNGTITVKTEPQRGTAFTIRIPRQMSVTNALIVETGQQKFALPFKLVRRIFESTSDEIESQSGSGFLTLADTRYPFRRLVECLGLSGRKYTGETVSGLVIESEETAYALAVDRILRPEEIIIRPLPRPLNLIKGVIGAATLGSGELVPILDIPYLISQKQAGGEPLRPAAPKERETIVMIVDDSPSVRFLTKKVIENAGWKAVTAKDGLEALDILRESETLPGVILSDVEMPRMDGYAFAKSISEDERLSNIPVIMITSRSGDKHREIANDIGVLEFLAKPYDENELLGIIRKLTGKETSPGGR